MVTLFPEARTAFSLFDYDIERKTGHLLLKQAFSSSVPVGPKGFQSIGYVVVHALRKGSPLTKEGFAMFLYDRAERPVFLCVVCESLFVFGCKEDLQE